MTSSLKKVVSAKAQAKEDHSFILGGVNDLNSPKFSVL